MYVRPSILLYQAHLQQVLRAQFLREAWSKRIADRREFGSRRCKATAWKNLLADASAGRVTGEALFLELASPGRKVLA